MVTLTSTHELAVNPRADDTGFTAVAVCSCGESFLGVGDSRIGDARRQWQAHADPVDSPRGPKSAPNPPRKPARTLSELVAGIDPRYFVWDRPGEAGALGKAYDRREVVRRLHDGESMRSIALALGINPKVVARIRREDAAA